MLYQFSNNENLKIIVQVSVLPCFTGNHTRYLFIAQSAEEKAEWMKCIEKSINDTVYNGFKERKRKLAHDIPGVY